MNLNEIFSTFSVILWVVSQKKMSYNIGGY